MSTQFFALREKKSGKFFNVETGKLSDFPAYALLINRRVAEKQVESSKDAWELEVVEVKADNFGNYTEVKKDATNPDSSS